MLCRHLKTLLQALFEQSFLQTLVPASSGKHFSLSTKLLSRNLLMRNSTCLHFESEAWDETESMGKRQGLFFGDLCWNAHTVN